MRAHIRVIAVVGSEWWKTISASSVDKTFITRLVRAFGFVLHVVRSLNRDLWSAADEILQGSIDICRRASSVE